MKIRYHRVFRKTYAKLKKSERDRVDKTIILFQKNPFNPKLKNHQLKGKKQGKRAISAGGDLRLVLKEYDKYILVVFLEVGSHNQVY